MSFLMALEGAPMARDQCAVVIDTDAIGINLHRDGLAGQARRHRIVVGVEGDPELTAGADIEDAIVLLHAARCASLISPRYTTCRCTMPPWRVRQFSTTLQ